MYTKNTKIVCTLGPVTDSVKKITSLIHAGMNVARLNFSHGTYENHAMIIRNIHKAEKITGKKVGILQDLQGPKIRVGEMPKEGIKLKQNKEFTFTIRKITGKVEKDGEIVIPIRYKRIIKDVKKGDTILINDGLIDTKVLKVTKTQIKCQVRIEGLIKTGNGINLPTSSNSTPTITDKDKKDLKFGLDHNVDFIALSFVKSKKDIEELRAMIKKRKKETPIIAKIERHEAVKNLIEIIKASDAVMVARGDLGADIPAEQVPIVQKRIIAIANRYAKPVITATQVLYSMVKKSHATRAEISDAANAIFDHTDAIMLSNETAVGKYPVRATTTLTKVASTVEKEMHKHEELLENIANPQRFLTASNAACLNAAELAVDLKADFIVVYTIDGYTARQVAKHKLSTPIITITNSEKTARELTLVWGQNKVFKAKIPKSHKEKPGKILEFLKKNKLTKKGQKIVILCNASSKEKIISSIKI